MDEKQIIQAVCITADVIDSRINQKERELNKVAQFLNEKYASACITPFTRRMGDEVFGILANYSDAYYVLKDLFFLSLKQGLPLYVGIGIGDVYDDQHTNNVHSVSGTAIWNSADAVNLLKGNDPAVNYFKSKQATFKYCFYAKDQDLPYMLINYMAALLFEKIESRTKRQTEVITMYEKNRSLTLDEIGTKLGYDQNAGLNVSKTLIRSDYYFVRSAEKELVSLLKQIQR